LLILLNLSLDYLIHKEFFIPLKVLLKNLAKIIRGEFSSLEIKNLTKKNEIRILFLSIRQIFLKLRGYQSNLEKRIKEISLLTELSNKFTSVIEIDKLFPLILEELSKITKAEEAILFILDRDKETLEAKHTYGIEEERKKNIKFKIGEGIAGWVAEKQEGIFLNSPEKDKRFKILSDEVNSLLCVPLVKDGETLGVISLASKDSKYSFNENQLQFLTLLSSYIAISLKNAFLYNQAITDELTGLYTYRYFKMRLKEEINRAIRYKLPLSLLMVDIDFFKRINDEYGHQCGDYILRELAKIIKNTTRATDISSRYGGEEFSIILPGTEIKGATRLAERLRKKIEESEFIYQDKILKITVSIGISILKEDILEEGKLIEQADLSLYNAKRNGRNRVCSVW
jgi:diguanylate cyclase (GGDEF)-like protein